MYKKQTSSLIGNTPVVRIKNNVSENVELYAKLESFNLTGSVKDRPVYNIIKNLYKHKIINANTTIIEYTSGNTGISLAGLSNLFKNNCIIVMPKSMSKQRRKIIRNYGARLVLVDGGMNKAKEKAYELLKKNKNSILLNQFESKYNLLAHYKTAKEILKDLPDVDAIVAGIGTGGTITGIAKYLLKNHKNIDLFGVEPLESPLLTQGYAAPHKIQGIGANFIPPLLDKSLIKEIIRVSGSDAIAYQGKLLKEEGLFLGISSGASYKGALEVAKKYNYKKILFICPDSGDRYL